LIVAQAAGPAEGSTINDAILLFSRDRHTVSLGRTRVATIVALYRGAYAGRHDADPEQQCHALAISNSLMMGTWALAAFYDQ
jgi:hypothetical protein